MKKKTGWVTSYEVTGWVCDIAAAHELGSTDVTVWPTRKSAARNHAFHKECGGLVKLTITFERPGRVMRWPMSKNMKWRKRK